MRTILALVVGLAVGWPRPADAQRIDRLAERVTIDADGSGSATVEVVVGAGARGGFRLPISWEGATEPAIAAPAEAAVAVARDAGRDWLVVSPGANASDAAAFRLSYRIVPMVDLRGPALAYGVRRLRCRFVNTTGLVIGKFERTIILPPGYAVSSVDDVVPATTESSVTAPYALSRAADRSAVTLSVGDLLAGDEADMTLRFKARASHLPLAIAIALASGLYLYRFRDLVARQTRKR